MKYRRYKNELDYSYALGAAPVIELIKNRPELVRAVFVHPDYRAGAPSGSHSVLSVDIFGLCSERTLPCAYNQKIFNVIADKENIYVAAAFGKRETPLAPDMPHAVFVNPGDAGNLGTNIRTCLGFGLTDIAIIKPGADVFAPKAVRASMGALFRVRTYGFASYDDYVSEYPARDIIFFTTDGEYGIESLCEPKERPASLVFGNEATGLPPELTRTGKRVRIAHSDAIDSLNLSVAVGVAAHAFYANQNRTNAG